MPGRIQYKSAEGTCEERENTEEEGEDTEKDRLGLGNSGGTIGPMDLHGREAGETKVQGDRAIGSQDKQSQVTAAGCQASRNEEEEVPPPRVASSTLRSCWAIDNDVVPKLDGFARVANRGRAQSDRGGMASSRGRGGSSSSSLRMVSEKETMPTSNKGPRRRSCRESATMESLGGRSASIQTTTRGAVGGS